jgi:hypothetical protein
VLADALLFKGEDPTDPLAIRLLNAIVNLLFYPNFTVSPLNQVPAESAETFPLEHVWEPGVGVQDVRERDLLSPCTPCVSVVCDGCGVRVVCVVCSSARAAVDNCADNCRRACLVDTSHGGAHALEPYGGAALLPGPLLGGALQVRNKASPPDTHHRTRTRTQHT